MFTKMKSFFVISTSFLKEDANFAIRLTRSKMEIQGKIIFIGEARTGTSARSGQPWTSQDFVIETVTEQYPRKCVFSVFGADKIQQFNLQMGQDYTVSFDIDAHEYNGRWFNSVRAWKVVPGTTPVPGVAAQPSAVAPAPAADPLGAAPAGDVADDLPF